MGANCWKLSHFGICKLEESGLSKHTGSSFVSVGHRIPNALKSLELFAILELMLSNLLCKLDAADRDCCRLNRLNPSMGRIRCLIRR
jgi:hypothetical protein